MERETLLDLILYVIWKARDLDGSATAFRLHKYLYLIDLEYYRRHGQTLTGLDWTFYHYGPYSFEVAGMGRALGMDLATEDKPTAAGHTARVLYARGPRDFPEDLKYTDHVLVDGILSVWSSKTYQMIYDYVYDSEPVAEGRRGKLLAWSKVRRGSRYVEFREVPDPELARRVREQAGRYRLAPRGQGARLTFKEADEEFAEGMRILRGNEAEPDPEGFRLDMPDETLAAAFPEEDR